MLRAALFDLDGLMVDTEMIQSKGFEMVASSYGVTPSVNENGTVHVVGESSAETWNRLKDIHGIEASTAKLVDEKREAVMEVIKCGVEPMPGLGLLLADLKKHEVKLAVVTNAQRERAHTMLGSLGVESYFSRVTTANDLQGRVKPDPFPYAMTAHKLGISNSETIVLEDAESGVAAAHAASIKATAVPNQYTAHMDFGKADLVVPSLAQLNHATLQAVV